MKKLMFYLLALAGIVLLTQCKEEEKTPTTRDLLIGNWANTKNNARVRVLNTPLPLPPIETDTVRVITAANIKANGTADLTVRNNGRDEQRSVNWSMIDDKNVRISGIDAQGISNIDVEIKEISKTNFKAFYKVRTSATVQGRLYDIDAEVTSDFQKK